MKLSPKALLQLTNHIVGTFLILLCSCVCCVHAEAQTRTLTMVVLIDSTNTAGYNTSPTSPGTYQMGAERYLQNLQIPYQLIDVSKTPAPNLTGYQLIVAAETGLTLGVDWQNAIVAAVNGGTGFVNFDASITIGQEIHIQTIFGATGATLGQQQTSIVVPAAVQPGGATPHYIDAMQLKWAGDDPGDIVYPYHGNGTIVIPSEATLLTGAKGTVVAELGTDPLIIATTYGQGRAVDFTTLDYLHADRFGFVNGADDLFWRSLVWAARKPFVVRGYPRIAAIQLDDNEPGVMSRIPDTWNTTFTGTVAADGTGGPWNPQMNMQLDSLTGPGGERAQLITAIQANQIHASPHGLDYGSSGDLYWNLTVPNTDAQWQAAVAATMAWKTENGGTDTFPTFSRSMVAHFWDLSNNSGYEMYNTLGLRYITAEQAPGTYYWTVPKTAAQRLPYGPFRIYEQPPIYGTDDEEDFPFFYADDVTVGSVAGKPAQAFYGFASQVGLSNGRFTRPDALFPSTTNGSTVAQSLNQWEYYMWHFWAGMEPVQIYTHDGDNLEYTTTSDRQSFITQLSQWFSTNHGTHVFMDNFGDYLRARNHSLLSTATISGNQLTLNFTGGATDADGHLIPTKAYIFYGDDEGTLLSVPGFSSASSFTFTTTQPANMQVTPLALTYSTPVVTSPSPQTLTVGNFGGGTFTWSATSSASWLTLSPSSGSANATTSANINSTSLAAGTYNATLTFTAPGATNSPQVVPVTLVVPTIPQQLVPAPTSLVFGGAVGGANPAKQTVQISNPGGGNLTWTATSDSTWLTAATGVAGTPGSVIISATVGSLAAGVYTGHITLKPSNTAVASVVIPVSFQLEGPIFTPSMSSLSAWTLSTLGTISAWSSSGGAIHYTGAGESQLYAGNSAWTDYDLDVNLTLSAVADYPGGIRARVNPTTGAGYALWMYPSENTLTLFKVVNWNIDAGYTVLATANTVTFTTAPHTLRLGVHGSLITASFDGVPVLSATDSTYTTGLIALDPSNKAIAYNSAVVSATSSQTAAFTGSPTSLTFNAVAGATTVPAQIVSLTSSPASVTWTAASTATWLTVTPTSGTATPSSVTVGVLPTGMAAGTYTGSINLTPSAGPILQVPVTFTISAGSTATLGVTPTALNLFTAVGASPAPVSVAVQNLGTGTMPWTAASSATWLVPSPTSASAPGTLTLTASTAALAAGTQAANVTVASTGAAQSPITIPVTVHLGTPIFTDNFTSSSQWTPSPLGLASNWSVANNTFKYNGGGATQQYAGSQTWANYIVSTNVALSNLNDYPGGLRGRVNLTSGASYAAWIYPADHVIKLWLVTAWDIDSSGLTLLGQSSTINFDTNTHALRLGFNGSQITVYYDNAAVITATDSTMATGAIALDVSNQPITFSNVQVLQ